MWGYTQASINEQQNVQDREMIAIMGLAYMTAFMMVSQIAAVPARVAVSPEVANVRITPQNPPPGIVSTQVTTNEGSRLTRLLGEAFTAEERAIVQEGCLAGPGSPAYDAAQPIVARFNEWRMIQLAESNQLAQSRYMAGLGTYVILAPDRDIFGNIGSYFWHGPGGPGYYGIAPGGGFWDVPGFPGFPGGGYPPFNDGWGYWSCVGGGDLDPPLCHWNH